jgi:predicted PurR-regulated permease PerM
MEHPPTSSPAWGRTTKLVVAISMLVLIIFMLVRFQYLVAPVVIAFVVAYILYPISSFLHRKLRFNWRLAVGLVYMIVVLLLISLLTWGGFNLVTQVQNLINFIQTAIKDLPQFLSSLQSQVIAIGPFTFSTPQTDLTSVVNDIIALVQPVINKVGSVITAIASGAINLVTWTFFSMLISFFVLSETGGQRSKMIQINIPGFESDFKRIQFELGHIWNAFLRGQLLIVFLAFLIYLVLFGGLGLNFFFGLALMAAIARFIPWVGPLVVYITIALVAYFQGFNPFELPPVLYAGFSVLAAYIIDLIIDQMIQPRFMGDALKLHPAGILVAALIGLNLFGFIGLLLAAPTLATLKLAFDYTMKKMVDEDPWEGFETLHPPKMNSPIFRWIRRAAHNIGNFFRNIFSRSKNEP